MSLWALLCALMQSQRRHLHSVPRNLGAWSCPKYLFFLQEWKLLSFELKDWTQLQKSYNTIPSPPNFIFDTLTLLWQQPNSDSFISIPERFIWFVFAKKIQNKIQPSIAIESFCVLYCTTSDADAALSTVRHEHIGSATEAHSVNLFTHCSWAHLKATESLEVSQSRVNTFRGTVITYTLEI